MTTFTVRTVAPTVRVSSVLERGVRYWLCEDWTPEQAAAAFERKFGRPAGTVICVGRQCWIRVSG